MSRLRCMRIPALALLVAAAAAAVGAKAALGAAPAPVPYSTPAGVTLVDISTSMLISVPQFLWRRLGDAEGKPLYTYDTDPPGRSSCYGECARQFPPFLAAAHARASGDWSLISRGDRGQQWAYQGKALYRYSGKDPAGEPIANDAIAGNAANPAWHDPGSSIYSPQPGWRRAAYAPEKTTLMPPTVELDGLAIASGFGFVEAAGHRTLYAAPVAHRLSADWQPLYASDLARPLGDFSIVTRAQDGTLQWAYKGEALYTYAGDYAPGEVTGIFNADAQVRVALAYRNFMPAGMQIQHFVGRAPLMTTAGGQTLYYVARFFPLYGGRETRAGYGITYNDAKSQGTEGCQGDCTRTWRPVLAGALDQARGFWEIATRPDGSRQWVFQGSPVYTFIGDKKPGDITGNNRHVIVYGGPQGQVVYVDAGGDPRDAQPMIGNISMELAAGPPPPPDTASKEAPVYKAGAGLYWHTLGGLFY